MKGPAELAGAGPFQDQRTSYCPGRQRVVVCGELSSAAHRPSAASDNGRFTYIYTPTGSANPNWAPQIITNQSIDNYTRGNTYTVYGARFNGMAQGAVYGDDIQAATNYPIVRFTNNSTVHVFYGRTSNTSHATGGPSYGVQTPGPMLTTLQVPAGMETGLTSMVATVNGIASNPITVNIH